ncbi:MAG: hypothetical protein NTW31_05975 [Bacteroidetes bacterium]|nr:hypothetical protein [Bacteroidota bacterium]
MKKKESIKGTDGKKKTDSKENSDDMKFIEEFIEQKKSQNAILKEIIEKIKKTEKQNK